MYVWLVFHYATALCHAGLILAVLFCVSIAASIVGCKRLNYASVKFFVSFYPRYSTILER